MGALDHGLALAFGVGYTAYAWWSYSRLRPALIANEPGARSREYQATIAWLWVFCLATVALWLGSGRPLHALGLAVTPHWRLVLGAALTLIILAVLAVQARWITRDARARELARSKLAQAREYLPQSAHELRLFLVLSVTAGVCEELLYRGYLLWYVGELAGQFTAVMISSIVFGLAHLGHGLNAAARATVIGGVFAGVYLLTGSLWIPIVVHTGIDVSTGMVGWYAWRDVETAVARPSDAQT